MPQVGARPQNAGGCSLKATAKHGRLDPANAQPNYNNNLAYNNNANIVHHRQLVDETQLVRNGAPLATISSGKLMLGIFGAGRGGQVNGSVRSAPDEVRIRVGDHRDDGDGGGGVGGGGGWARDGRATLTGLAGAGGIYAQDHYRPYTIFDSDNDKLAVLPTSTTGSLSSIITTSVASSEPDPALTGRSGAAAGGGAGAPGGAGSGGPHDAGLGGGSVGDADDDSEEKLAIGRGGHGAPLEEEWWKTTLQVSIPFFIAGIGTIGAGIILGRVEHWKVFHSIRELFILVPALLGLKGNLDMCLASRLSTQANLGNMSSTKEVVHMIIGNISLVQVQATVAAFIVAIFAISIGAAMNNSFVLEHAFLLVAASMFTATSSCFVLDFVLVAVILISHKFKMNPDNLATPLAASIGDVVSLSILSFIASLLYENILAFYWIPWVVIAGYFLILPLWVLCVLYNRYTRPVLKSGWVPVLSALFISGLGGLVLDKAVDQFDGFVVFQPIINGIGGNLVSVQASKISTMLHQSSILGIVPPHAQICESPWRALFRGVPYAKTARILILMSIPGQIVFIFVADYIHLNVSTIGPYFVLSYMFVSLLQICSLLYIAHIIIHAMWKWKIDPDNSAIPYLTALGDLFGSSLLAIAFLFLQTIGHQYGSPQQEEIGPDLDLAG